jgi:hypothetical protein
LDLVCIMCSSSFDLLDLSCSPCLGEVLFTLVPVFVLDLVFWLRSAAQSLLSDFSLRLVFNVSAVFVLEFNFLSLLILRQGSGSVSTKGIFSFPCFSSAVLFFFEIESLAPAFFRGNVRDAGVEPPPTVWLLANLPLGHCPVLFFFEAFSRHW